MDFGFVIGSVTATRKDPSLQGTRFVVVQPTDERERPLGRPLVAVDTEGITGVGSRVYFVTGADAASVPRPPKPFMPIDAAVVGVIDSTALSDSAPVRLDMVDMEEGADE